MVDPTNLPQVIDTDNMRKAQKALLDFDDSNFHRLLYELVCSHPEIEHKTFLRDSLSEYNRKLDPNISPELLTRFLEQCIEHIPEIRSKL